MQILPSFFINTLKSNQFSARSVFKNTDCFSILEENLNVLSKKTELSEVDKQNIEVDVYKIIHKLLNSVPKLNHNMTEKDKEIFKNGCPGLNAKKINMPNAN